MVPGNRQVCVPLESLNSKLSTPNPLPSTGVAMAWYQGMGRFVPFELKLVLLSQIGSAAVSSLFGFVSLQPQLVHTQPYIPEALSSQFSTFAAAGIGCRSAKSPACTPSLSEPRSHKHRLQPPQTAAMWPSMAPPRPIQTLGPT